MILKEIYQSHLRQLHHLEVPHQKIVICFSGIPASGKTTLAKKIEERYGVVRINNDAIREIIAEIMIRRGMERTEEKNQKILHEYLTYFLEKYTEKNKCLLLDSGIDRSYEQVFACCKGKKYPLFIIRLETPLKEIRRRLAEREKEKPEHNSERLKKWIQEYREGKKKIIADVTVRNVQEEKKLFEKLDEILY